MLLQTFVHTTIIHKIDDEIEKFYVHISRCLSITGRNTSAKHLNYIRRHLSVTFLGHRKEKIFYLLHRDSTVARRVTKVTSEHYGDP